MRSAPGAGYQVYPSVFGRDEIGRLVAAIEQLVIPKSRAGARHVLGYPPVATLAHDPRLRAIASAWLERDAVPFKATLFDKNPNANWLVAWHQDTALPLVANSPAPGWGPWSNKDGIVYAHAPASALERVIALRIHLEESTTENGPLRVLPGTHALGVLTDEQVRAHARRLSPHDCCAAAGGVVAMRPLLIHASSKSSGLRSRRVLHLEYAATLEIAPGMHLKAA